MTTAHRVAFTGVVGPDGLGFPGAAVDAHPGAWVCVPVGPARAELLGNARFDPGALRARGLRVLEPRADDDPAFVPPGGGLFEHLTAGENVAAALRAAGGLRRAPADALAVALRFAGLETAGLDTAGLETAGLETAGPRLAPLGADRAVSSLTGLERLALAVARARATGHTLVVLAAPSTALAPEARARLPAALDALCRGSADGAEGPAAAPLALVVLDDDPSLVAAAPRVATLPEGVALGAAVAPLGALARRWRAFATLPLALLWRLPVAALEALVQRAEDLVDHGRPVASLALARPLPLFVGAGLAIGVALTAALARAPGFATPAEALAVTGGAPLLAVAPALSTLLFAATGGAAVARWIAGLEASGAVAAIESLGGDRRAFLHGPAALALVVAAALLALAFAAAAFGGAVAVAAGHALPDARAVLTRELYDPWPAEAPGRVRALALLAVYAGGAATGAIAAAEAGSGARARVAWLAVGWVAVWEASLAAVAPLVAR